jgi:hypothetical protein
VDQKNPRAVSEKYQKMRRERPEDTMKLNALFKQAIQDIKKEKREAIAKGDKIKADKAREEMKKVEKKKKGIEQQIVQTKRKLKKVGQSEQKAISNVQRFTKQRDIAAQKRDMKSVQKFTRVSQKRQQNLVRARGTKQKLIGELRKLEQEKGSVSKSPLALTASPFKSSSKSPSPTSPLQLMPPPKIPKPMLQLPAPSKSLKPVSPLKLPASPKSPKPTTPMAREAERAKQKAQSAKKQQEQAMKKQQDIAKQKAQSAKKQQDQIMKKQQDMAKQKAQSAKKQQQDMAKQKAQIAKKQQEMAKRNQQAAMKQRTQMMKRAKPMKMRRR